MQNPISKTFLGPAECAKMIRKELKATFPTVKFSVTSQRFAGGTSIRVSYTDGPTKAAVEAIATKYGRRGFDGSDDSTYFVPGDVAVLTAEGIVAPTYGGFVFVDREYSDEAKAQFGVNDDPFDKADYWNRRRLQESDLRLAHSACIVCGLMTPVPTCADCASQLTAAEG